MVVSVSSTTRSCLPRPHCGPGDRCTWSRMRLALSPSANQRAVRVVAHRPHRLDGVIRSCTAAGTCETSEDARYGQSVAAAHYHTLCMLDDGIVNGPQRRCAYNASKAAVTALVKSFAFKWGPRNVRVNAVSPG